MGRKSKYILGTEKKKLEKEQKLQAQAVEAQQPKAPIMSQEKAAITSLEGLTKEQVAQLVADYTRRDPFALKGLDPRFRYRFLNRNPDKLDRQTMRGWEIVTGNEAEDLASKNKIKTRMGQIQVGDAVLAKIPFEMYVAIKAQLLNLNRRMIGQSSSALRRDMGSKYSRNVEESLKIRDRGMKEETVI